MEEKKGLYEAVVVFLNTGKEIMLMMKTAKIGKGCWNGPGGGIKKGETPASAAVRELWEESGVVTFLEYLQKVAVVDFHNIIENGEIFICRVHYFFCNKWFGFPESRPEENMVNPTWFSTWALPYKLMMPADKDFIPFLFKEENLGWVLEASAFMGSNQSKKLKATEMRWVSRSD